MTVLLENPIPVILLGIIVEAMLVVMLVRTGRGALLWAMGGVLILVLAGVAAEWLVVTDREQVEATFDAAAAALEANDLDGLLQYIHPSATQTRQLVRWALAQVRFLEARITHLDIVIIDTTSPPTAKVQATGMVHFQSRSGLIARESYLLEFSATLRREGDRWVFTGHQWRNRPPGAP